jgi:16S rRNA (guanine1516-N2)-methyltransferase
VTGERMDRGRRPAREKPLVDFESGAFGFRFRREGGRGNALARAVGLKPGDAPFVVDATAGLGRDAMLLASLGARVTLVERSPAVFALLEKAIAQARDAGGALGQAAAGLTLTHGDAIELLPGLAPDVVTVDPMHPLRPGAALVKKEMRELRELVGADPDAAELMEAALASARKRVVLKWPLRAPPPPGLRAPSHQIIGKTVRYDVFVVQPRGATAS